MYVFQKKKTEYLIRQSEQEKQFAQTIIRSQMEIKENTLKNIAWELHDNVGTHFIFGQNGIEYIVFARQS